MGVTWFFIKMVFPWQDPAVWNGILHDLQSWRVRKVLPDMDFERYGYGYSFIWFQWLENHQSWCYLSSFCHHSHRFFADEERTYLNRTNTTLISCPAINYTIVTQQNIIAAIKIGHGQNIILQWHGIERKHVNTIKEIQRRYKNSL